MEHATERVADAAQLGRVVSSKSQIAPVRPLATGLRDGSRQLNRLSDQAPRVQQLSGGDLSRDRARPCATVWVSLNEVIHHRFCLPGD
jgi:hypothetical protein